MSQWITFNKCRYDHDKLIKASAGSIPVTMAKSDIEQWPNDMVKFSSNETIPEPIVVVQFENKYYLVAGRNAYQAVSTETLSVKLMSRHAFKKCKVVDIPEHERATPSILRRRRMDYQDY